MFSPKIQNSLCKTFSFWYSILENVCFWPTYGIFKFVRNTSKIAIIYILWERSLYKKLVMIEFHNDYNLPNLVEEKTCYKTRKTKFLFTFLQITVGVKYVQIRRFFWSVFSCSPNSIWKQENTEQKKLRIWTLFTQ